MEPSAGGASQAAVPADRAGPSAGPVAGGKDVLEWTVSPWRESPLRAALAVAAALALWLLAAWLLPGQGLLAVVLGLAALGSLAPGMAPTCCRVDGAGVARRRLFAWERRGWSEVRRLRLGPAGLHVSPFARPSRLDPFRGLFLPLPRQGAGALRELLRREVDRRGL